MSRLILPLGGKKARLAVDEYLDSILKAHGEVEKEEQASSAAANDLEKIRRKQYEELKHKDIITVYEDDERRKEWEDAHIELAEANLQRLIREGELDDETLTTLTESEELLMQSLSRLDSRVVSDEEIGDMVDIIRGALKQVPALGDSLIEFAGFDIQERMYKRCDELQMFIQGVEARVKDRAVSELETRVIGPSFWQKIMADVQAADAPRAAWARNEEIEDLHAQLSTANGEVSRLEKLNDELFNSNAANEKLATTRETELLEAQSNLESEQARKGEAENAVAVATNEKSELREKQKRELEAADERLRLTEDEKGALMVSLDNVKSQMESDREAAKEAMRNVEEAHAREVKAIKQDVHQEQDSLAGARSDLNQTLELLDREKRAHESTRTQLSIANDLLEKEQSATREKRRSLEDAERKLRRKTLEIDDAEREMKDLRAALEREKRKSEDAERVLEVERERTRRVQDLLDQKTSELRRAKINCSTAGVKLGGEEAAHRATKNLLADARLRLDEVTHEQQDLVQQGQEALEQEQSAHKRAKRALEDAKESAMKQRTRNQEKLQGQQQMNAALQNLAKTKSAEQETQHQAAAAFLTFCSASLMHGSLSPLFVASGGLLLNSRFNQAIAPSVAVDLPWIHDILDRVIKAVTSSEPGLSVGAPSIEDLTRLFANCKASPATEGVPALPNIVVLAAHELNPQLVHIVLLQGIAYMYLALRIAGDVELRPTPSRLLEAMSELTRDPVLKQIYDRVFDLVHGDNLITTWVEDDESISQRFDSRNSALPEGVVLFQGTPGVVFMTHAGRLFVFDERVVRIEQETLPSTSMRLADVYMWLPPVDGFGLQILKLKTNKSHLEALRWAFDILERA